MGINNFRNNGNKSVTINGETYFGSNIQIVDNVVTVDGKVLTKSSNVINVSIIGDVGNIKCSGSVDVSGNAGDINCGGSCTIDGSVSGDVDCGGSCKAGTIQGNVEAGGSVSYRGRF